VVLPQYGETFDRCGSFAVSPIFEAIGEEASTPCRDDDREESSPRANQLIMVYRPEGLVRTCVGTAMGRLWALVGKGEAAVSELAITAVRVCVACGGM
jgi:hypothetical protein